VRADAFRSPKVVVWSCCPKALASGGHYIKTKSYREFTLLLCAFTIFIISYNLNPSLHVIGLTPGASLQKPGLGSDPGFDADGRRPESFRDDDEDLIFGDWEWLEGEVAGSPSKTRKEKATAQRQKSFHHIPPSANNQQVEWPKKHPSSVLVKHIPRR